MENATVKVVDRLSDLPDHLIHHIMSFLSYKKATRLGASSKHLSSIWSSLLVINFNEMFEGTDGNKIILKVVRDVLAHCRTVKPNFQKLIFHDYYGCYDLELYENSWLFKNLLNFAIGKKIRELKLGWKGHIGQRIL